MSFWEKWLSFKNRVSGWFAKHIKKQNLPRTYPFLDSHLQNGYNRCVRYHLNNLNQQLLQSKSSEDKRLGSNHSYKNGLYLLLHDLIQRLCNMHLLQKKEFCALDDILKTNSPKYISILFIVVFFFFSLVCNILFGLWKILKSLYI